MGDDKPKSGSQRLCEHLLDKPLGYQFTNADLEEATKDWGFGDGVVSGFIVRAKKKGMVAAVASQKGKGKRPAVVYELVSHEAWKFHGPGIGSHAGREINARKHDPIPSLMDLMFNRPKEEEPMSVAQEPEEEYETERVLMTYDTGSLADQLMELAIQVNDLENKKPSLSGFTTDELLEELRSRLK